MTEVIEKVRLIYKELFTLRFLHTGFGTPRPIALEQSIQLEPDADTKTLFFNHSIGYQFFNDTLLVYMRCADSTPLVPFVKISENVRIRFLMQVSADFLSKTLVDPVGAKQIYQFSNVLNVGTGGFVSMHTEGVNGDDLKTVEAVSATGECFAVIDVANSGAITPAYELFSGSNDTLNSPSYSLRFISKI